MTPEELEEQRRKRQASKVAQSQASATPIQAAAPLQAPAPGQSQSPLAQVGGQVGQKLLQGALGSALGPLGGMLGGLFNNGGKITAKNRPIFKKGGALGLTPTGGVLQDQAGKLAPKRTKEATFQGQDTFEGIAASIAADRAAGRPVDYNKLAAMQRMKANQNKAGQDAIRKEYLKNNPEFRFPGGSQGVILRNAGGPISGNPQGYNEGGSTMGTPIKKVMDIEKLDSQKKMDALKEDQAERTWYMAEKRKDEAHAQAMQQKEESHALAMKLKKESATMKAPLSKGE